MDISIYFWMGKSYIIVIPCGILCEHQTWDAAAGWARCATTLYPLTHPSPNVTPIHPFVPPPNPGVTLPVPIIHHRIHLYFPSKPTECCSYPHVTVQPILLLQLLLLCSNVLPHVSLNPVISIHTFRPSPGSIHTHVPTFPRFHLFTCWTHPQDPLIPIFLQFSCSTHPQVLLIPRFITSLGCTHSQIFPIPIFHTFPGSAHS